MSALIKASLHSLVPHSDPMILIEDPFDSGSDWVCASVRIGEDSMFYKPRFGVPAWIGVEYMAQTIALYAGIRARQANKPISVGFLLGTKKYTSQLKYFPLGSRLHVLVTEVWQDEKMAVHVCRIDDQSGVELAAAELKVYRPEDSTTFFKEHKE